VMIRSRVVVVLLLSESVAKMTCALTRSRTLATCYFPLLCFLWGCSADADLAPQVRVRGLALITLFCKVQARLDQAQTIQVSRGA
jgi:hypothetical protein